MSFVQVQQSLITHRKTMRLARELALPRMAVVGMLVALWSWCLDNAMTGYLGPSEDDVALFLADVCYFDGAAVLLLDALLAAGFLDREDDGALWIHDWEEHMGTLIAARAQSADRSRNYRDRLRARHAPAEPPASVAVTPPPTVTSPSRHAHVTRTSRARVEKSRVETLHTPSAERDNASETDQVLSLSLASPPEHSPPSAPSPPLPPPVADPAQPNASRPRPPDVIWDACVSCMDGGPTNDGERGKWNKGVKLLKQSGATTAEVLLRAQRFRDRFGPDIPLHPMSLALNWRILSKDVTSTSARKETTNDERSRHTPYPTRTAYPAAQRRTGLPLSAPVASADEWHAYKQQLSRTAADRPAAPTPTESSNTNSG